MGDEIDQEIEALFGDVATNADETTTDSTATDDTTSSDEDSTSASEDASTNNDSEQTPADTSANSDTTDTADKTAAQTFSAEDKFSKQNKAFAEMRIKNKEYETFLMNMARVAKLDVKGAQDAMNILSARIQATEAKQKQMDPTILKELEDSRKQISEMQAERLKERTISDFARLKATHSLSDAQLNEFADTLISKNKNPFEQEMDLVNEYRLINFDKLIEAAREQGRQEEIARSTNAKASSTTPGSQRATPESTGEQKAIKNPEDLDTLFKSLGI